MTSVRPGCTCRAERIAVLLASDPPEVKMISWSNSAPISAWSDLRAPRNAPPTLEPKAWIEEALPNCSEK